ncbi:drug/metabolite transporter (DMT)-like permease [Breoghania corrubedonensis]|uniref:Drug/metabolite transporter (DMT)-like permease n=1 Tax=Breoghania corrubedonensis TaxID=665038 RepID=A0A2T5UU12_9HYPH|nr:DMT family transporter [Breoghania corrubedonensis]PTW54990.1 drug/metabolite transporter (DMT)-like permease [Breoghania corrubedonensis]
MSSQSSLGKGIALAFLSFATFSFSDACVKLLGNQLDPFLVTSIGSIFSLMALPFVKAPEDRWSDVFRTSNRTLWMVRAGTATLGSAGSVTAFSTLPMAEAFALIFLLPSFVTILSILFLKEQVGWRRWAAVAIGFAGVLIVLRPGFRELSIGHLGALFGGLAGAVSVILFRAMGPSEKRISLYGAGFFGPIVLCAILMIPHFTWPNSEQWVFIAGYGLLAGLANVVLMRAAHHAPANALAPSQYSQMLWALLLGWLIARETVDAIMLAGIALIILSGLLTLMRERVRGTPLPPPVASADAQPALSIDAASDETDGGQTTGNCVCEHRPAR